MTTAKRALVSTIRPENGGVPRMAEFLASELTAHGIEPVLCFYEPYSKSPDLSVPSFAPWRRPRSRRTTCFGHEAWAHGAWLPELEFTTNWPTDNWRRLVESCDVHLVASGNCLPGTPFALLEVPFLAWLASPWDEDRRLRAANFPWPRRVLDRSVNAPVVRRLERRILQSGHIVALSEYTRRSLTAITDDGRPMAVLPFPIDTTQLTPDASAVAVGSIGFAGRLDEPRKNLTLLVDAVAMLPGERHELVLIGSAPPPHLVAHAAAKGIRMKLMGSLTRSDYVTALRSLDVFVVASDQEGLCISALEAMACGCPVVSTRCGGPEEYVVDGDAGYLTGHDAAEIADRIGRVVGDRLHRRRLSEGARHLVASRYTHRRVASALWENFVTTFGERPPTVSPAVPAYPITDQP